MCSASNILAVNDQLPLKTSRPIHSGKVRSVYWLDKNESRQLIERNHYPMSADTPLAVMIISDRLSAFDCIWHAQGGWLGVPGKGAALNAISNHWFEQFKANGLADSHIVDIPHPFVWIVQQAKPIRIEAIARQYITGSMWRAYQDGEREFCGIRLPDNLTANQRLDDILITPSTKGVLKGIPNVPETDDVNITRQDIFNNYAAFNFEDASDITRYEDYLTKGFQVISDALAGIDQVFVDTKFEFGYVKDKNGKNKMIYMDEVGTPDSSRIWDGAEYRAGRVVENSKEGFRQSLLSYFDDSDILLNKSRMSERANLAKETELPQQFFIDLSNTYLGIAEKIIGKKVTLTDNPESEILDILNSEKYRLVR